MTTHTLLLQRAWTMRPWRHSPLMRASYRAQYLVHTILLAAVILAIPATVSLGIAIDHRSTEHAAHLRSVLHTTVATLDADAGTSSPPAQDSTAPAHWSVRGVMHTGTVTAESPAKKGDTAPIWIFPDGRQSPAPPEPSAAVFDGILAAVSALTGVVALALISASGLDRLLDRRRRETWALEWATLSDNRKWNRL